MRTYSMYLLISVRLFWSKGYRYYWDPFTERSFSCVGRPLCALIYYDQTIYFPLNSLCMHFDCLLVDHRPSNTIRCWTQRLLRSKLKPMFTSYICCYYLLVICRILRKHIDINWFSRRDCNFIKAQCKWEIYVTSLTNRKWVLVDVVEDWLERASSIQSISISHY